MSIPTIACRPGRRKRQLFELVINAEWLTLPTRQTAIDGLPISDSFCSKLSVRFVSHIVDFDKLPRDSR